MTFILFVNVHNWESFSIVSTIFIKTLSLLSMKKVWRISGSWHSSWKYWNVIMKRYPCWNIGSLRILPNTCTAGLPPNKLQEVLFPPFLVAHLLLSPIKGTWPTITACLSHNKKCEPQISKSYPRLSFSSWFTSHHTFRFQFFFFGSIEHFTVSHRKTSNFDMCLLNFIYTRRL